MDWTTKSLKQQQQQQQQQQKLNDLINTFVSIKSEAYIWRKMNIKID